MRLISVGSNDNVDTDSDQDDGGSSQPVVPILDSRSVHSPTTPGFSCRYRHGLPGLAGFKGRIWLVQTKPHSSPRQWAPRRRAMGPSLEA